MASPTIPTSFVPHQQFTPSAPRPRSGGPDFFLLGASAFFVLVLLIAGGTFGYQKYLESSRDSKEATVAQEEKGIDQGTVAGFVALSNRLAAANVILANHITTSTFFDLLEGITLQNVSITSLSIAVADDRTATLSLAGTAKSFNALAAQSAAFAQQPLIKHAIFSGLDAAKDGTVDFTVIANLDPKLVMQSATPVPAAAATTTPSVGTTTASTTASAGTASATTTAATTTGATSPALPPPPQKTTTPPPAPKSASTTP